jgi:glycosyltransferase involved in cell wall biosynthesis
MCTASSINEFNGDVVNANQTPGTLDHITVAVGGFAPIGGVETLVHSLALALHDRSICAEVICWGAQSPLLADLETLGTPVLRTRFQWGCRWGLPDRLMFALRRSLLGSAKLIVFPKLLRPEVHQAIRRTQRTAGNSRSVLITPYRPAEMWASEPPSQQLLECFDAIITQSADFEADLRKYGYKGPVSQLPDIPPKCELVVPSAPTPLRIGFLGRLAEDKRLDYLLEAVSSIPRSLDFRLELFGDGPLKTSLKDRVTELGLGQKVKFNGFVERSKIKAAIDSCSLFAFSSRTEGLPVAAIEILSRGRPIVATRVGIFPELLADGTLGRLVPSDDPVYFGRVLVELGGEVLSNPSFAPQSIQDVYATRFGNSAVVDNYVELFKQILSSHQVSRGVQ